jgi:hypothetical protein
MLVSACPFYEPLGYKCAHVQDFLMLKPVVPAVASVFYSVNTVNVNSAQGVQNKHIWA